MPIKLNITFAGLCLYLPEENGRNSGRLHVLLLAPHRIPPGDHTGHGHDGHEVEQHYCRLFYDIAYEEQNGGRLSEKYRSVDLENTLLDLTRFEGGIDFNLRDFPDVSAIARDRVPRDKVGLRPGDLVACRVTVDSGSPIDYRRGGPWELEPGTTEYIAYRLTWQIPDVGEDRLDLTLEGLNGQPGETLPSL